MRYKHKKTGAIIDVPVSLKGDFWELIEPETVAEEKIEEKPKARRAKQAAKEA